MRTLMDNAWRASASTGARSSCAASTALASGPPTCDPPITTYRVRVPVFFHISSVRNRESIGINGLDWTRMGSARGIAGSHRPELDGVHVDFFVRLNNTGDAVDVWQVNGVDRSKLLDNGNGFEYLPERVSPDQLELVRTDVAASR